MVNTNIGDINVELLSDATVLEIRPDGRIAKVSLVIYKCIFRKDDKKKAVPRETLVIASVENGDQVFRVNGQPVDPDTATALSLVLWLDPQEKSEDQVFGTSEQKRVGESWAIKAASVADWPLQARTDATGADIKGVVTVSKKVSIGAEDCLVVNYAHEGARLPQSVNGVQLDKNQSKVRLVWTLPVDTTRQMLEHSRQFTVHAVTRSVLKPGLPDALINMTIETRMTAHYSPL